MTAPIQPATLKAASIQTVARGHGYRIIRRVRLHGLPRQSLWERLSHFVWPRLTPEAQYARQQRLEAISAEKERCVHDFYWDSHRS